MKIFNKVKKFQLLLVIIFIFLASFLLFKNGDTILSMVNNMFFANGREYTKEIPSITIKTDDYDAPGSFQVTKSAVWTDIDEAEIHFEVDSEPLYGQGGKVDVLLVFDVSGSMIDDKLDKVKEDSKEFIEELTNGDTRVGIITFNNNAKIESDFTTDKDSLLAVVDNLKISGGTSYSNAFSKVDELLSTKTNPERTVKILFLTDGIPTDNSFISKYEVLKDKYPNLVLSSIQYRMGENDYNELKDLSDYFYNSKEATKENILVNAFYGPELKLYDNFVITDFIDNDNFTVESINDIKVTDGKVSLKMVDGQQQIVWDFSNKYISGQIEEMTIKVKLKDNKSGETGFYPTNTHEIISYSIEDKSDEITSYDTPVLKNKYIVSYDPNYPEGCDGDDSFESKEYGAFNNVTIEDNKLSCDGYLFKGFVPSSDDLDYINDDVFIMPRHDVDIKGVWTKVSIEKSMDGTVFDSNHYLNEVLQDEYKNGSLAQLYTGEHQDTMGGVGEEPIYYYNLTNDTKRLAASNKNNVVFAGHCWQILRTTDTGGVKLLYNGEVDIDGTCGITRPMNLVKSNFLDTSSIRYKYYYSSSYTYDESTKKFKLGDDSTAVTITEDNKDTLVGKYTCFSTSNATCNEISEIKSLSLGDDGKYYAALQAYTYLPYSYIGSSQFNYFDSYGSFNVHGYMYNKIYPVDNTGISENVILYETKTFNSSLKYSETYDYDGSKYSLSEPILTDASSSSDLVNKYVSVGNVVYYVVGVSGTNLRCISVDKMNDKIYYGTSYNDNNDGTYTLVDYDYITIKDYFASYSDFIDKYICYDADTCSDISRIVSVSNSSYFRVSLSQTIMIADDYVYENGTYKLSGNTKLIWDVDSMNSVEEIQNKKYTCFNLTGECEELKYITSVQESKEISSPSFYYVSFSNGEDINNLLDESFNSPELNKNNSMIKGLVDDWYEKELLDYTDYIDDVIYCNDRELLDKHFLQEGENVASSGDLFDYNNHSLKCSRQLDSFSVSNEQAKLKYPIGLLTLPEIKNNILSDKNNYFWLSTPLGYGTQSFTLFLADKNNTNARNPRYVRPTITLKSDTLIDSGTGSTDDPYTIVYYE